MTNSTRMYHIGLQSCGGEDEAAAPCFRAVLFTILALLTLCGCILKLVWASKADRVEQYFVACFVLALLETAILLIGWTSGGDVIVHFIAIYLHVLQFLVICVYYARRMLEVHKQYRLIDWLCYPMAFVIFLYFTGVLSVALIWRYDNSEECQSVAWLLFSGSMMGLAIFFIIAGVSLTKAMSNFPTSDPKLIWWKQIHLWSLILVYAVSSSIEFGFDLAFPFLTEDGQSCDGVFGGPSSAGYTAYVFTERLSLMAPVWVMFWVLSFGSSESAMIELRSSPAGARGSVGSGADSVDSAVHWDVDDLSGYDINGPFEATESTTLLASAKATYQ